MMPETVDTREPYIQHTRGQGEGHKGVRQMPQAPPLCNIQPHEQKSQSLYEEKEHLGFLQRTTSVHATETISDPVSLY